MKRVAVSLPPPGGEVHATTVDFLGDSWKSFMDACAAHGLRWNKQRGRDSANIGPAISLPALVRDLSAHGFEVVLDDGAKTALHHAMAGGLTDTEKAALAVLEAREEALRARGLALREFQRDGVVFLSSRKRALLGDEMGVGKTIQALCAIPDRAPVIVVCPNSVKVNWAKECRRWRPDLRPVVVLASASRDTVEDLGYQGIGVADRARWPEPGVMLITNYESMPSATAAEKKNRRGEVVVAVEATLDERGPGAGTVLIGDELHRCKNPKAKMTLKWGTLRDAVIDAGGWVWGATGTPIYNRPFDLCNILRDVGVFNDVFVSWKDFLKRMGGYSNGYAIEWTGNVEPSVAESMKRVMLRREKKDVLKDLPPKTYRTIEVKSSPELDRAIAECGLEEVVGLLPNPEEEGFDEDAERDGGEMRRISEIDFESMSAMHALMSKVAYAGSLDLISDYEEQGEPLVVFSPHREPIEMLGRRDGWATILGGDDAADRARKVEAFQEGRLKGIALTIGAGREGITLTRSSNALFLNLSWTPADNQQAGDRIHRIGQTRGALITYVIPDHPLVRRLVGLLTWKERISEVAISRASLAEQTAQARARVARDALAAVSEAQGALDGLLADAEAAGIGIGQGFRDRVEATRNAFLPPSTPLGRWICESVVALANLDPDRARARNDVGFNGADGEFGHSLARQVLDKGGLTVAQYRAALRLLVKYHRQVGRPPVSEAEVKVAIEESA